jgi:hypothetical protein
LAFSLEFSGFDLNIVFDMVLRAPYVSIAINLQEAADMMHSDVRNRLQDAIQDAHRNTGTYASYIDHNGDGESGDVVYSANGDTRKAPYEIQTQGGKAVASVDTANSTNVVPCTTYQEEADDDDNYASMMEAKLYAKGTAKPLCERFISKTERNNASGESFAGKGKSFPILKPGDVMAAVRSMGRAGSDNYGAGALKANIIRIAKAKGFANELPKAWRGDSSDSKESHVPRGTNGSGALKLFESAATLETIKLTEAKADYEIKLIAPGKGSSAYYPESVLRRDGPSVFKAGTHVYLNHPTAAEEAARPEGDVKNLAGVLSSDAVYHESHAKGPGLYARMKVFQDHAQTVEEKAPHVGMSIRASGFPESGAKRDGVPVLKSLTSAESVDVVTRAGAGGMILSESARTNSQEVEMTEADVTKLVESAVAKATSPLRERAVKGDAIVVANRVLAPLALNEAAKQMVVENVLRGSVPLKEGELDEIKFTELVTAEAKRVGAVIAQVLPFGVRGMGVADPAPVDQKVREAHIQAAKDEEAEAVRIYESLGLSKNAAAAAAKGRAA